MSIWDWFHQCRQDYLARGDQERHRLTLFYNQGYHFRETDPDRALALFTEGRDLAEQLDEPWWALFYDKFRVDAHIHFKRDFRKVLDLAVHCAVEVRQPRYAQFPERFGIHDSLIAVYLGIDPEGYADAIQEALAYLENEIPPEPEGDRFLMLARQRIFAMELENYERAREACLRELALAEACRDRGAAAHFATFVSCALCKIAHHQGQWQELADFAQSGEDNARRCGHQCELGEVLAWQAVARRRAGQEDKAQRLFRGAAGRMARLGMPPKQGYFDARAAYFELADNAVGALQTRDRELAAIAGRGRHLYECRILLERLRLLARIGPPYDETFPAARAEAFAAAQKLRFPQKYVALIESVQTNE